jgi:hypothetical protein
MEEVLGLTPLNLNDSIALPMKDVSDVNQRDWSFTATSSALLHNTQPPLPKPAQAINIPKPAHGAAY